MAKLRTQSDIQDFLDKESGWRVKEIMNLKIALRSSSNLTERTIIRAGVPLLYAHWEGFVKSSAMAYLRFIACQKLSYEELASCFIVFGLKNHLNNLSSSKKSHLNIAAVDFFLSSLPNTAKLSLDNAVNTESNLSSAVFENIVLSIGIDPKPYTAYYNLLDESLLKRRNSIAHGEYLDLFGSDFRALADEVVVLLRLFKTDVQNAVGKESYKRSPV